MVRFTVSDVLPYDAWSDVKWFSEILQYITEIHILKYF